MYDQDKDVMLHEIGYFPIEKGELFAAIFSYDKGAAKLRIQRKVSTRNGTVTAALGSMTRAEANVVAAIIQEAEGLPPGTWTEKGKSR